MNKVAFIIPAKLDKLEETRDFYVRLFGFAPHVDFPCYLTSKDYPQVELNIQAKKGFGQKNSSFISFSLNKNLPSLCKKAKDFGYFSQIVTDMLESSYTLNLVDPSGSDVYVHCNTLLDDSNVSCNFETID